MNKHHIFCNFDIGILHKKSRKNFIIFVYFDEKIFRKNY